MRSPYKTATSLLSIEDQRDTSSPARVRFAPAVLGISNLFFCAYMDGFIRSDPTHHYLSLFILVECSVVSLVCCVELVRGAGDIIRRTTIFPVSAWSYVLFLVLAFGRHRVLIALLLSDSLFMVVAHHLPFGGAVVKVMFIFLAFAQIVFAVTVVAVRLIRSGQPLTFIALIAACFVVTVVFAMLIVRVDSLLRVVPVVSWTVNGIVAAQHGDAASIVFNGVVGMVTVAALGVLGYRSAR